jgi:hypothetical protein
MRVPTNELVLHRTAGAHLSRAPTEQGQPLIAPISAMIASSRSTSES